MRDGPRKKLHLQGVEKKRRGAHITSSVRRRGEKRLKGTRVEERDCRRKRFHKKQGHPKKEKGRAPRVEKKLWTQESLRVRSGVAVLRSTSQLNSKGKERGLRRTKLFAETTGGRAFEKENLGKKSLCD